MPALQRTTTCALLLTILYNILYYQRPILSLHPAKME